MLNKKAGDFLAALPRRAVEYFFSFGKILPLEEKEIDAELLIKRGSFVTITKNDELRGCIGLMTGREFLFQDVCKNAIGAAFHDDRFIPLSKEELPEVDFEVSVLTEPVPIPDFSDEQFLNFLKDKKPGLVLENNGKSATFLPQVWEDLSDPEDFLRALSKKAGLEENDWRLDGTKFYEYQAEIYKERNVYK